MSVPSVSPEVMSVELASHAPVFAVFAYNAMLATLSESDAVQVIDVDVPARRLSSSPTGAVIESVGGALMIKLPDQYSAAEIPSLMRIQK